nr:MAG TPA: hypothetical protein [Caudoviricetes sp.]
MVTIKDNELVITIEEHDAPEVLVNITTELLSLLYAQDSSYGFEYKYVLLLLQQLTPSPRQLRTIA